MYLGTVVRARLTVYEGWTGVHPNTPFDGLAVTPNSLILKTRDALCTTLRSHSLRYFSALVKFDI
jgi:hypothetical protein